MDRLSSHRFLANGHKLMTHLLAYALFVLFREANEKMGGSLGTQVDACHKVTF